jgi:hypothetical protein
MSDPDSDPIPDLTGSGSMTLPPAIDVFIVSVSFPIFSDVRVVPVHSLRHYKVTYTFSLLLYYFISLLLILSAHGLRLFNWVLRMIIPPSFALFASLTVKFVEGAGPGPAGA